MLIRLRTERGGELCAERGQEGRLADERPEEARDQQPN
jgi:hypothetical protein